MIGKEKMNVKILWESLTVLVVFISVNVVKFMYSILYLQESFHIRSLRFLAIVIFCLLSFYSYKNNKIATWIMGFIILVTGVGSLVLGIILVSTKQLTLKILFIILGVYLCYGSIKLIKSYKERMIAGDEIQG